MPLPRVVTDLGADLPFAPAAGKLQEHYGIVLSPSTIRQVTEGHARALIVDSERTNRRGRLKLGRRR